MSLIQSLAPTTELEAVNTMLSAIGEAPITSTASTATDVVMAVNLLKATAREVCNMGWRFNMEWGYEVGPGATTLTWRPASDPTSSETLNVFAPPTGLARFRVTACRNQIGSRALDLVVRSPRNQTALGATYPYVFYDRARNRDGLNATMYPSLYIDPVWFVDYEDMPESARRYIAVRAARQLAQQVVGSAELSNFSYQDEVYALRVLKRYEGQEDDSCNMFDHMQDAAAFLGNRSSYLSGVVDDRNSSRPAAQVLASITVTQVTTPNFSYVTCQFSAAGVDTHGDAMAITPTWSCDSGTIDEDGLWTAPEGSPAPAEITATVGGISGSTDLIYLT